MSRRLTVQERALWSRVAASVRPLKDKMQGKNSATPAAASLPPAPKPAPPPPQPVRDRPAPPPRPLNTPKNPKIPVVTATLDGGWDRRLRQGDISPDRVIDLHGHTLAAAYDRLDFAIADARGSGQRILLIVTGKGRGDRPGRIRGELSHWLDNGNHRSAIAALRPAHPRHGGGGAFYLILRR